LWGKSKSFLKKQGKKPRKALFSCAYPLKMPVKTMPETRGRRSRAGLPDKKHPKTRLYYQMGFWVKKFVPTISAFWGAVIQDY